MDIYALEYLDTYTKQILSSGLNMNTILLNDNFQPNRITNRLEICQKIYTTEDFWVNNLHRKCVISTFVKSRQKVRKCFELG